METKSASAGMAADGLGSGAPPWLKYPLLIGILYLTIRVQELAFREVDPFSVPFTLGRGHGIADGALGLGMRGYLRCPCHRWF